MEQFIIFSLLLSRNIRYCVPGFRHRNTWIHPQFLLEFVCFCLLLFCLIFICIPPINLKLKPGAVAVVIIMVFGFTTTYAISVYHHRSCEEFESRLWRGVLDTTLCDKVCKWLAAGRWFSPVSCTIKTNRHGIAEKMLNVALSIRMYWLRWVEFHEFIYPRELIYFQTTKTGIQEIKWNLYSGFHQKKKWPARYSWHIFESGVKHHNPNTLQYSINPNPSRWMFGIANTPNLKLTYISAAPYALKLFKQAEHW
jgi:hypothetical protein